MERERLSFRNCFWIAGRGFTPSVWHFKGSILRQDSLGDREPSERKIVLKEIFRRDMILGWKSVDSNSYLYLPRRERSEIGFVKSPFTLHRDTHRLWNSLSYSLLWYIWEWRTIRIKNDSTSCRGSGLASRSRATF